MNKERFQELCTAYVLGALEEDERRELEHFLEQADQEYLDMYQELKNAALHLPLAAEQLTPPDRVRQRIMSEVRHRQSAFEAETGDDTADADGQERLVRLYRKLGLHKPQTALSAVAAMLLITVGLTLYSFVLNQEVNQHQVVLEDMRAELQDRQDMMNILEARRIEYIRLDGSSEIAPDASGKLICDLEEKRALFQTSNLPDIPEDQVFQLWLITEDDQAISKGVFDPREAIAENFFKIDDFIAIEDIDPEEVRFGLTIEPRSGSEQPTGEPIMSGQPALL